MPHARSENSRSVNGEQNTKFLSKSRLRKPETENNPGAIIHLVWRTKATIEDECKHQHIMQNALSQQKTEK